MITKITKSCFHHATRAVALAACISGYTVCFSSAALAGETYGGIGFGQSKFKGADVVPTSCSDLFLNPGCGFSTKDNSTTWRLFGGYQFNENFAVEVGYSDFGKATIDGIRGTAQGTAIAVTGNQAWEATGLDVSAVGLLPFSAGFTGLGRFGFLLWDVQTSGNVTGGGTSVGFSGSDNGTSLVYGLGVAYDFNKKLAGRLEWQEFKDVGDSSTVGKADIDVISFSLAYRFR